MTPLLVAANYRRIAALENLAEKVDDYAHEHAVRIAGASTLDTWRADALAQSLARTLDTFRDQALPRTADGS